MPRGERGVRGEAPPQEKLAMSLNFNIVVTRQTKGEEINFSPFFLVRSKELLTELLVGSALSFRGSDFCSVKKTEGVAPIP